MTTAPALSLKLNDGHSIPSVGLGCWIGRPGVTGENQETELMVKTALEVS
jgi:diketogulonate reductase-like aldo/keto reductase